MQLILMRFKSLRYGNVSTCYKCCRVGLLDWNLARRHFTARLTKLPDCVLLYRTVPAGGSHSQPMDIFRSTGIVWGKTGKPWGRRLCEKGCNLSNKQADIGGVGVSQVNKFEQILSLGHLMSLAAGAGWGQGVPVHGGGAGLGGVHVW